VKSGKENTLFNKYQSLSARMGKGKSAVAVARKMVSLAWLMLRRRELYRGINRVDFERNMKRNNIRAEKAEITASASTSSTKYQSRKSKRKILRKRHFPLDKHHRRHGGTKKDERLGKEIFNSPCLCASV
jgi:pyridoxine/pyridoxamine 5'-phosphate oxidase